jgi:hypothetical protein
MITSDWWTPRWFACPPFFSPFPFLPSNGHSISFLYTLLSFLKLFIASFLWLGNENSLLSSNSHFYHILFLCIQTHHIIHSLHPSSCRAVRSSDLVLDWLLSCWIAITLGLPFVTSLDSILCFVDSIYDVLGLFPYFTEAHFPVSNKKVHGN